LIQISSDYYRLCYSLHSSYNEICTFVKQISPTRLYPIALPDGITSKHLNKLLQQFEIDQNFQINFAPNNTQQQIKRRYQINENENENLDDELDFTCQENNEKQLFKRICNLQRSKPQQSKCDHEYYTSIKFFF
jgi:hypothetical protein